MSSSTLIRWSGLANILAGVLVALWALLHPGGGDPATAETIRTSPYALEHTLAVAAFILAMLGLVGLYALLMQRSGWLGLIGFLLAFVGYALIVAITFVDGYLEPIFATQAPQLLADSGPLNTFPGVLILAIPGIIWGIGVVMLAILLLRAGGWLRWAAILLLIGDVLVNLPPQPVGPFPKIVALVGFIAIGVGLAWVGYAQWSARGTALRQTELVP